MSKIAEDLTIKIMDEMMAQKLTTHMGKTGLIGSDNYKFKQQQPANTTWKKAKKWYREALAKLKSINEEAGLQTAFSASNGTIKSEAQAEAKAEISRKLGESFDTLAIAATAKADIHDSQVGAIATLTATNATLVETNATLTAEVKSSRWTLCASRRRPEHHQGRTKMILEGWRSRQRTRWEKCAQ